MVGLVVGRMWTRKSRAPTVDISPAALEANPYPVYRRLRESAPVAFTPSLGGRCLVARWDDVEAILKDDDLYSARIADPPNLPANLSGSIFFVDGDEHTRLRTALQPPCQPRRANELAETVVARTADELIDRLWASEHGDLVEGYFEPITAAAVSGLAGLDPVPIEELRDWVSPIVSYISAQYLQPEAEAQNARFEDALRARMRTFSGSAPGDETLLGCVLHQRGETAARLTEHEILTNVKLVMAAGFNEARDLLAHTLLGLLSRPEQLEELRADPSLARAAVEEGARWASPVGMVGRTSAAETELGGFRIPAGTSLAVLIASANRDEARWTDGGRFDLHRDEGMHLAFASGVHFCLGAWVVRAAGAVALQRLVERLPSLRLQAGARLEVSGWRLRVVQRLPASWS